MVLDLLLKKLRPILDERLGSEAGGKVRNAADMSVSSIEVLHKQIIGQSLYLVLELFVLLFLELLSELLSKVMDRQRRFPLDWNLLRRFGLGERNEVFV